MRFSGGEWQGSITIHEVIGDQPLRVMMGVGCEDELHQVTARSGGSGVELLQIDLTSAMGSHSRGWSSCWRFETVVGRRAAIASPTSGGNR